MKTIIACAVIIAASLIAAGAHAQATPAPALRTTPTLPTTPQTVRPALGVPQAPFTVEFAGSSFPAISWSQGAAQSSTAAGIGRATPAYVMLIKAIDASSAALGRAAATAQKGTLTVTGYKSGKAVAQWVYSDAILTSVKVGGGSPNQPQETLTFHYVSVKTTYY